MTYRAYWVGAVLGLLLVGCGEEEPIVAQPILNQPPGPTAGAPVGDGPGYVFAVRKLFFGDTTRGGGASIHAWRDYGYDIDGDISWKESTGLCQTFDNAPVSNVYPDGEQGIDNAFGKLLIPSITGFQPDLTFYNNQAITVGQGSLLLRIDGLGDSHDYTGLDSYLYTAGSRQPPLFEGNDIWPVRSESLAAPPSLNSASAHSPDAYLTDNTWVGRVAELNLPVRMYEQELTLPLRNVMITMELSDDRNQASHGIIAGTLAIEPLLDDMYRMGQLYGLAPCGPMFEGFWEDFEHQVRGMQDILIDGSQDPTQSCNAISIGLGFEAVRAHLGEVAPPIEVPYACE